MGNPSVVNNRKVTNPSMRDLFNLHTKEIMLSLNSHAIATVQSFDPDQQTITATVNYKKSFEQQSTDGIYSTVLIDYPILLDVPLIMLGGGNASLTFPTSSIVGAECVILFNDRDIDNWFQTGQVGPVASGRTHSFSDGLALVGVRSIANSIDDYDTTRVKLALGAYMVGISASHIKIANATDSLGPILQSLITAINSLITATAAITVTPGSLVGPSSPPLNAAAITAVTATLTTIATKITGLLE